MKEGEFVFTTDCDFKFDEKFTLIDEFWSLTVCFQERLERLRAEFSDLFVSEIDFCH